MVVSITGATGFVGTKLVESLLKDGHEVRVLTRSIKQAKKKIETGNVTERNATPDRTDEMAVGD